MIALLLFAAAAPAAPATRPFYAGADVSMLPELEAAGAAYRRDDGTPGDAITILSDHGVNLFRLRLFVDPTDDFTESWGATQDLATVRKLAGRVKASGAAFLLDLHYSDTWADPAHQTKPAAWAELHGEALERKGPRLHGRGFGGAEGRTARCRIGCKLATRSRRGCSGRTGS